MSDIIMEEQNLYDIADAIREKLGVSDEYLPSEMAGAVRQISGSAVQSDWDEDDTTADDYIKNKPTNVSDFNNDSGFVTSTVNNLVNYYKKTETYTQAEVDALISAIVTLRIESVSVLPTTDISTTTIYLVPSADPKAQNVKDEYINTDGTSAGWELIGSTAIDLTGYVTDAELTTALADYTTTANLTTLLAGKQDTISDLSTIRSGASAGSTAYQKPDGGIPKTDLASSVQTSLDKADTAPETLVDLDDVDIDTPASGDSLTYNGDKWINNHAEITSSEPYTFRQGLGTMADMEIVGGTVAWNQLVYSYDSGTLEIDNVRTRNVGLNSKHSIVGHVYYISANILSDTTNNGLHFEYGKTLTSLGKGTGRKGVIYKADNNNISFIYVCIRNTEASGASLTYEKVKLFDLTAMFGSTIADYIYTLEQANEGDGVAWFRKYFPKDYYAYDAGSLQSVEGLQSRDVSGFNQWDEEWEVGVYVPSTGKPASDNRYVRSKNRIELISGGVYYIKKSSASFRVFYYDDSDTFISNELFLDSSTGKLVTIPSNAKYMRFHCNKVTYNNHDICINLSDPAKNGIYEPYRRYSYPLDSSLTLRGIPKLDANNQLYYDGDEYESDGTVTRRYGIVDLGTLEWTRNTAYTNPFFLVSVSTKKRSSELLISSRYPYGTLMTGTTALNNMENLTINSGNDSQAIFVRDDSYTDPATFKTAMSGVYLVYELATPTTESAQPYQNPQRAFSDGTEGFTMTGIVPVGNNTTYQLSKALIPAEDYTDGAIRVVQREVDGKADKDMISDAWVSGQAYSVRDYCIYGDTIYRCIQTVTQGTAIMPTNTSYWTPVKIAAEIKSAKSDSNFALLGIAALEDSLTPSYHYNTDALSFLFQSYDSSVFPSVTNDDCVIVYGNIVLIHLSVGGDLAIHYMIGKIKDSMRPPGRSSGTYTAEVDTTMVITPLSGTAFDYSVVHVRIASNGDMIMSPLSPLKNNAMGTFTLMYIKSS